jgi:hypothetical protein
MTLKQNLTKLKNLGITVSTRNRKLNQIHSFSLPTIISCPDRTALCESLCYAVKFEKQYKASTRDNYEDNLAFVQKDITGFTKVMTEFFKSYEHKKVKGKKIPFRIHVAGDFFSSEYIKAWHSIVKDSPNTMFTVYTRAWRNKATRLLIEDLASLDNINVWASLDKDTGDILLDEKSTIRRAYLSVNDTDLPSYSVDILFRNDQSTTLTKLPNKGKVCPYEMGLKNSKKMNCLTCNICYKIQS